MNGAAPNSSSGTPRADVAEFQGLYGAFEFPERLLQKIWHLGYFTRSGLETDDGSRIEVVSTGDWNRAQGGPDFRAAEFRIAGMTVRGDVEIHFHPGDWRNHGHDRNPAFDNVALHVSLFAHDAAARRARTSNGREIPLLVLLPHLTCSIEEFAFEDALEQVTGAGARSSVSAFLRRAPVVDVLSELSALASRRWEQKTGFARIRIEKLGWEGACHHTALEILGYRHNRAQMLSVAEAFPLSRWKDMNFNLESAWNFGLKRWRVPGSRPANHPRLRLEQYSKWVGVVPEWPDRLANLTKRLPRIASANPLAEITSLRRAGFSGWRETLAAEVAGRAVSGTRLDTIVTNGFLPLMAASGTEGLFPTWCCWFAGDSPDWLKAALREAPAIDRKRPPLCEGLVQGALELSIEQPSTGARLGSDRRGT